MALSTQLTPDLVEEGIARDFVRQVQQLRKDADLDIEQRIRVKYVLEEATTRTAVEKWSTFIAGETLADEVTNVTTPAPTAKSVEVGDAATQLWIETA